MPDELRARERDILEFEGRWWLVSAGRSKRATIRDELGISPQRYYAILDRLADSPQAAAGFPLVVARLRRRQAQRRRQRFEGLPLRRSP